MKSKDLVSLSLEKVDDWVKGEPIVQQRKVLRKLLKSASKTAFGIYYDFDQILKEEDPVGSFQREVPFHDYNRLFDTWWHRVLAGKKNITWKGRTKYFALSSGTSNARSKRIPLTRAMFKSLSYTARLLFESLPRFKISPAVFTRAWLCIGGTSHLNEIDGHYEGYLSGINARKRPFWAKAFYKPGDKIATVEDFDDRTDLIAQHAQDWDVGLIVGIPHWVQLTMERVIEKNNITHLNELWPNLTAFVFGGVDITPYKKKLDELVGHPLKYINTYLASEGMIAYQNDPQSTDLQLILNNGIFFEFIPFEDTVFDEHGDLLGSPEALTVDQVREGVDYAVVISTCAGAWRYLLGDTVRFTDVSRGRITISGRTKYYLNLCTEHLTGDNMIAAIARTEEALGVNIVEFTIVPVTEGQHYSHQWYVGVDKPVDEKVLKEYLDQQLGMLNDDYQSERKTALNMELKIVPLQTFYDWVKQRQDSAGQSKIPRVIRDETAESWRKYVEEREVVNAGS